MKPSMWLVLQRKRRRRIASVETPFNFNVSHTSKKITRWRLGSSINDPPNCVCWTMETSADLNSKLFSSIVGLAMRNALNFESYEIPECSPLTSCSRVHFWWCFLGLMPLLKPSHLSPYAKSPFNLRIGFMQMDIA